MILDGPVAPFRKVRSMEPRDTSHRRKPGIRRERNYIALVGAIILLVVGLPAVLLAFVAVVEDVAAGQVKVGDILGKLFGLLVFVVIVVKLLQMFRGEAIQPGTASQANGSDFRTMTPGSPEYQAALDDFRDRQGEALAGSDASGFLRRRTEDEAESDMAVSAAVYRVGVTPTMLKRPLYLQGPYLALGLLGWGCLFSALVLVAWASEPGIAIGDAAMGLLCVPIWFLAIGSASGVLGGQGASRNGFQKASYRVIRKTWMSPGFTQALIGGALVLVVGAIVGLMMWHPPTRPGLGIVEGLLASYVVWGGAMALFIAFWTTRGARKK